MSATAAACCRLGYIDFLNSRPVYHALENGLVPTPAGVELVRGTPTDLNARLLRGEVDVSPISSIAYAQHAKDLVLLPGLSINSAGFVHSVTLFYRDDVETLRDGRVAVTPQSATSVILARALLQRRFDLPCALVEEEPDLEEIGHKYHGALLIGDDALRAVLAYPHLGRRDLGLEWSHWTGTPMVFAVWAARRDFVAREPALVAQVQRALAASKAWGDKHRGVVIERARKEAKLSRQFMTSYFRNLRYDLADAELAGLARYYEEAKRVGALAEVPPLAPLEVPA